MELIEKLHIDLSVETKEELNKWIDDQKEQIVQSRTKFIQRQEKYLYNWDDFITYTRKGPWDGSSNYHMPLTQIMVSAQIAKFYHILTAPEMAAITRREKTDDLIASSIMKLRDWYLNDYVNEFKGIKTFTWEMCTDCVTIGYGIGFRHWQIKRAKYFDYVANGGNVDELNREMADIDPQIQEMAPENPIDVPEKKIDVKAYREVERIMTEFEGTKLQTVDFTRAYFPNDIPGVSDMDFPPCVILQSDTDLSEIKMKEDHGEYFPGSYDACLKEKNPSKETLKESSIKDRKDDLTGYESQMNYEDRQRVLEHVFCNYDIDKDGIDERIVITRTEDGTILKATHLNRISRAGRRPIYKIDCFPKPRQAYSRGVPEFMYQLNEKMDMNENMKQDCMQTLVAPMFAYRSSSSLDKQKITYAPGQGIPVDDVNQDIRILSFNNSLGSVFQDLQTDWSMADRMMSTSALAQGQIAGQVGAQRSTSGIITLLKQMDYELIPRFQVTADQWKKLNKDLIEDLDYRVPSEVKQEVLGPAVKKAFEGFDDFNSIFRLSAMIDMKMDVSSIIESEEMRRNDAAFIFQIFNTPGYAQQFGIVNPNSIYESLAKLLRHYRLDPEEIISKPQFVDEPLTLWQEIRVISQGSDVPMSLKDNHEQKAQDLMEFLKSGEWKEAVEKGIYVKEFSDRVKAVIQQHMGIAQAIAPNAGNGQQSNFTQLMSGSAPQQGGQGLNTTSRDQGGQSAPVGNEEESAEAVSPEAS